MTLTVNSLLCFMVRAEALVMVQELINFGTPWVYTAQYTRLKSTALGQSMDVYEELEKIDLSFVVNTFLRITNSSFPASHVVRLVATTWNWNAFWATCTILLIVRRVTRTINEPIARYSCAGGLFIWIQRYIKRSFQPNAELIELSKS